MNFNFIRSGLVVELLKRLYELIDVVSQSVDSTIKNEIKEEKAIIVLSIKIFAIAVFCINKGDTAVIIAPDPATALRMGMR